LNIYVTGIGCVSSIGNNVIDNIKSLREKITGLKKPIFFDSKYASEFYFGEVNIDNSSLIKELGLKNEKGLTRTDLLSMKAFDEAVRCANLSEKEISSIDTAFISASTVGGMCMTDQLYNDANLISNTKDFLSSYSCSAHTMKICKKYQMKGISDTINTACSSSANSIMFGSKLIRSGLVKRAIVGGVDSLAKYTVNGFNSLQILSKDRCTPFDINRKGLNIGEGAAYLIIESEDVIKDKTCLAKISGYGNSNDAFHASSMSDNAIGITKAIINAIDIAGIKPDDIDYINAHGTGTLNNDFVELVGLKNVFNNNIPPFSSTKSYTGHTLGAAGAIEGIYSIFSLLHGELYPNLNFKTPIPDFNLSPITKNIQNANIKFVMSNSYGFSGNCTSLIFERINNVY